MVKYKKLNMREYLKENKLICDGALGTYYGQLFDTSEIPEKDNLNAPDKIERIHREYIEAGAKLIRTNTFASNTICLDNNLPDVISNVTAACAIAAKSSDNRVFIAGDIGPVPYDNISLKPQIQQEYIEICKVFIDMNLDAIVFETFQDIDDILPAISYVRSTSDIFIIVQFAVNQYGYSDLGLSFKKLFNTACECEYIDAVGFNCGIGPSHMKNLMDRLTFPGNKYVTAFPNAGYPQLISNRMIFSSDNADYFTQVLSEISGSGVSILGGCCGTTPEYIKQMSMTITAPHPHCGHCTQNITPGTSILQGSSFYKQKSSNNCGEKLIAVELAPPFDCDDEKLMDAAHFLKNSGVDVLTFPDSPSGRTRVDSILMAAKVSVETGMTVMPHLCCRDKNAIAMRSQLLGAHINGINNFLVITGDPIPSVMRRSVKSVFNFDAVGLMNIIDSMNGELFSDSPMTFGGAINQNRLNLDVEIQRVKKKMSSGASFFLTQPAFTSDSVNRLKAVKEQTGAVMLCGIMPLVSRKNALFMKNEMTGIDVPDEIVDRYSPDMSKKEGENTGISIAKEIMKLASFCDGYYFSFPFNRVHMLKDVLK